MNRFLTTSHKADRFEWWSVSLLADLLMQFAAIVGFALIATSNELPAIIGGGFLLLLAAFFLWLAITVTLRRLRDRGRSLWSALFYLIPVVGWAWMIIECGFLPSRCNDQIKVLVRRTVTAEQPARPAQHTPTSRLQSNI